MLSILKEFEMKLKYKRKDIVKIASKKIGLSNIEMKLALDAIIETMSEMLIEDESNIKIEIRNFGVFEVKKTKPKPKARNPKTNEEIFVPARRKVHFKPGKIVKDVLQKKWTK